MPPAFGGLSAPMSGLGHAHVELGMYPFDSVAWAWDEIWRAVHARAQWTPAELTRSGDVHARWYDTDCIVTHVCGWPFAALHRNDMELLGSFDLAIPEADGRGHYRSVLLSRRDTGLDQLIGPDTHVVANSADSLSGWISLLVATVGPRAEWPGAVTFTSSHRDSLIALTKGAADLACIDSWTLGFVADEEPALVNGLFRVGAGPRIPTPAVTARRTIGEERLAELAEAFDDALADPATEAARRALRIAGTGANTMDDYLATLQLRDT